MKTRFIKYCLLATVLISLAGCSFTRTDLFQVAAGMPDINLLPGGPGFFSFGSVDVYSTRTQIFTIENTGFQTLVIDRIYTSNPDFTQFIIDTSETSSIIEPGESTTFFLSFKPTSTVPLSVDLIIESNDPDETVFSLPVDGIGTGSVIPPDINVQLAGFDIASGTGFHDFGNVEVGNLHADEFIIENTGSAELYVSDISLKSGDFIQFSIIAPSIPRSLAPGETVTFTIEFSPQGSSAYSAEVAIVSDDPDETSYTFMLNGQGTLAPVPDIVVKSGTKEIPNNTGVYDFGAVEQFNTASVDFFIENTGTDTLIVNGPFPSHISPATDEYILNISTIPAFIEPGKTETLTVVFAPALVTGLLEADIELPTNDPDEDPYIFRVKGFASTAPTPDINITNETTGSDVPVDSTGHDYTQVGVGDLVMVTFKVENTGSDDLNIYDVLFESGNISDFSIDKTGLSTLLTPGMSTTFEVTFQPTEAKKKSVKVRIDNDDPDSKESAYKFILKGEGKKESQPDMRIFVDSKEYPDGTTYYFEEGDTVEIGDSSVEIFTIKNVGTVNLEVTSHILKGGKANDYTVELTVPVTVTPGGSLNFTVVFTPGKAGERKTTLEIKSNDEGKKPYKVKLTGFGEDD
jgi:uncharacterized cupredoxin-like copper-binding protein